jgi:dihydroorotate dehydrogenase (fumarate)
MKGESAVDLTTTYLKLKLASPVVVGASPVSDNLDSVKRCVEAGAAAIVMHSLFEEQIRLEVEAALRDTEPHEESSAEATSYFPRSTDYRLGPDQYLEQIGKIKKAGGVPVIASLNGVTAAGWVDYAKKIQQAGADALELNVYYLATDPTKTGDRIEQRALDLVRAIKRAVSIPVAVKVGPFFSSFAHVAAQLDAAGADGIVLFNRFYQPDLDVEKLEVTPSLHLSDSSELLLRLHWAAILCGKVKASLAVTGGVHTPVDAVKAVMAGAHVVQVVSAILKRGPQALKEIRDGMAKWLEQHEYESVQQARGSLSLEKVPDAGAYERGNYMKILAGWKP